VTRPRLSIIIPFYDETAYLRMALQSVAAQRLAGVETVVVNDNPDRFGPDSLADFGATGEVRVVHHLRNRGLSAARNTGLAATMGALVGFLDADDYYTADGLAAQLQLAEQSGADITQANAFLSQVGTPALRPLPRDAALFPAPRQGAGLRGLEQAQFITSSWSSLYRRDFLDAAGLRFDDEQVKFEDRLFVLQTVTAARQIACLGRPVRVWRRRAGSISSSPPDLFIHTLQVQLLEKCMAVMRAHAAQPGVPPRFLKRELFNTLSRLIWDIEVVQVAAARPGDGDYAALMARVVRLLGDDTFGTGIFDDQVLRHVSRVGSVTRHGVVSRVDFFALHRALRAGDAVAAVALLADRRGAPAAPKPNRRADAHLVLHLGMHKTGSTFLQRGLQALRHDLRMAGVLFPDTGLAPPDWPAVRPDGFPGHLGLLSAVRRNDGAVWSRLRNEIAASGCRTVILSCENMLLPVSSDREAVRAQLFERLSGFASVRLVAFVRRPDQGPEMLYRELACNGQRFGARSAAEFLVDYGATLTDLPGLFGPWEAFAGGPVALVDHDAAAADGSHWQAFLAAAGLGGVLGHLPPPGNGRTYGTPDRDMVAAARLVDVMLPREEDRVRVLRAFFAALPPGGGGMSLLPPAARLGLVDSFAAASADWAAARGYAPDLDALRRAVAAERWSPQDSLPAPVVEALMMARLQVEASLMPEPQVTERFPLPRVMDRPRIPGEIVLRLRPRPWLRRAIGWAAHLRGR
jgi:glycosyltransferase involved in cell wall biosynthesis